MKEGNMKNRKLTTGQALIAYWLPIVLIIALLGILLAIWIGTPKADAGITGKSKCATARGEKSKSSAFGGTLYWGSIAFTFCTNTRTGVITYYGPARVHWGLGDAGRLTGWHADGKCGGSGPRPFISRKKGRLTRALCYGEIGGKTRRIVFTVGFQGYVGGPSWYVNVGS